MSSLVNTDIFVKSSKKNKFDDITVNSSLFTTSTPSKMDDISDSAFMAKSLVSLHKKVLDSDLIPTDYSESTNYSQYGGKMSSGQSTGLSTMDLPINYSESTFTDTSALRSAMEYAYKNIPDVEYPSTSTNSSSSESESSSSESSSSESESESSTTIDLPKTRKISRSKPKKAKKPNKPKENVVKKVAVKKASSKKKVPKKISK